MVRNSSLDALSVRPLSEAYNPVAGFAGRFRLRKQEVGNDVVKALHLRWSPRTGGLADPGRPAPAARPLRHGESRQPLGRRL